MSQSPTSQPITLSPSERKTLALKRIEASRTELILRIYPEPVRRKARKEPDGTTSPPPPIWDGMAGFMARAERNGFALVAWRTARALGRRWWTRQPWHASVDLITSTLAYEAKPIMDRHPWATLAAGGAAGAAVVIVLPWAVRSIKAQAAPWRNNLGGMLWYQLGQAPVQLALTGALTAWIADMNKRANTPTAKHKSNAASAAQSAPPPTTSAAPSP